MATNSSGGSSTSMAMLLLCLMISLVSLSSPPPAAKPAASTGSPKDAAADLGLRRAGPAPVPVTAYVMSRCPDAARCEPILAEAVAKVGAIAEIRTDYIVRMNDGVLSCPHGDTECAGNRQQLCAYHLFKQSPPAGSSPNDWFKFVTCQSAKYYEIPSADLLATCAARIGLDPAEITKCADSDLGKELLFASGEATRAAGAKKSCTVHVAGKMRCLVDGGQWQDCEGGHEPADFVRTICEEYERGGGDPGKVEGCPSRLASHKGGAGSA
ncbi:hypothetical protein DFJ74DRAFT_364321 [Hyaloraphidium curvatum]|nr:hypothetical protein DFJ74DRAFT_364321 [Hyaloraphidium curvatum]